MKCSVVIVGGGMAGIKTASDLYHAGEKDTVILEARSRLGGRLLSRKTSKNPNLSYDLGASWFHDGLRNPLFDKARRLGNVEYFYDDGQYRYVAEARAEVPPWSFENVVKEINTFGQLYFEENPGCGDLSIRDLCQLYLEQQKSELTADEARYAQQVVRMWAELWDGVSWESASAKHAFYYAGDHLGRNVYVKNGYETVFGNEVAELPPHYQSNNIHLNTQVASIDHSAANGVTVTTTAGGIYEAEYVVVTVPTSVLRITDTSDKNYIQWNPPLPQRLTNLWPHTEFGSLGKVVFEFDSCFWPRDVQRFYVLASELSSSGVRPWQHPTLIVNYAAMSDVPSLVFLTQDVVSREVEKMSSAEVWALFKPVVERIASGTVKEPINILHTEWNSDPFARGSYSAGRIHSPETDFVCNTLAGGVCDRVRLAGAETTAGSANGCAHGAYFSGEREARYILQHKKAKNKF